MSIVGSNGSHTAREAGPQADHLGDYLARIGRTPLLTAEEEIALAERVAAGRTAARLLATDGARPGLEELAADGQAAREHLIRANLRLVVAVAKRYAYRGMSWADVVQDGNLGLIEAVERFDHTRGHRFSTCATWWIRKYIQQGLEHAHTMRLPIGVQDELGKLAQAESVVTQRLGRTPTEEELAAHLGEKPAKLVLLRRVSQGCVSLDLAPGDLVEDPGGLTPVETAERKALKETLATLVAGLAPRQAMIVRMRFGLDGQDEHTPRQVADRMGLTSHWVRQLERESLARLCRRGASAGLTAWIGLG
ncbi:RNA polymerase principal sigma factor HrdB [Nonomuraea coxensis DSM 45129]|uniref:RNA polymerase sigma factor n=1 Tax=Nonomuraea coxensis DSM 45129 TaxID=1122611 RepID=A0ABX8U9A4_9ACTN|nr:sigma-70 family RNA polymerase sigma factor [Nonomuraea coxensis]QYC43434.1 RNA polymerase principal sigma factor HrdB [Nonomuraea coxensis DSM 45129]